MQAARWQCKKRVAGANHARLKPPFSLDGANNKAREIVLTRRVKIRHLGSLAADQRAPSLLGRSAHALDNLLDDARIKLPHRQIIQKKQRLGALRQNIVHAMIQNIRTDGGMNSSSKSDLELRAHAIGASHQNRIAKAFAVNFKQRPESTDGRKHAAPESAPGHGANTPLRLIGERNIYSSIGVAHRSKALYWSNPAAALESMEQALPAHFVRMNQSVEISSEALFDVARLPNFFRRIDGHVNKQRSADNIRARHEAPEAAVVRIIAIVAHHKIIASRNFYRPEIIAGTGRIHAVRFDERFVIYINDAALHFEQIAGKSDGALDKIGIAHLGQRRAEDDNLLALRLAPKSLVPRGERNADIVADAADNQMVSDQNSLLHRAAGNHAGLHDAAFDEKESKNHPEPGNRLAH